MAPPAEYFSSTALLVRRYKTHGWLQLINSPPKKNTFLDQHDILFRRVACAALPKLRQAPINKFTKFTTQKKYFSRPQYPWLNQHDILFRRVACAALPKFRQAQINKFTNHKKYFS